MPEPGTRRAGVLASLRPRVSVPRQARGTFAAAVPCLVAVWALGGLYLSLGPSLATQVTGSRDLLWGGLVVFLLTGVAAAATVAFRGLTPRTAMLAGCLVLIAGLAVTFAAIATTTAAAFLAGTAVAGVGFGLALLGVNRILIALAAPAQRAGLIAAIFIINFLGLSIPALIAGVATAHVGLHRTALAYCVAMATLVAAAAGSLLLRNCGTATGQGTSYAQVRRRPVRAEGPGQPAAPAGWLRGSAAGPESSARCGPPGYATRQAAPVPPQARDTKGRSEFSPLRKGESFGAEEGEGNNGCQDQDMEKTQWPMSTTTRS